MLVNDFLETNAFLQPDKIAIIFGDRRVSYGEIDTMANRLANTLIEERVGRGDRVAIYMDNSPETAIAVFATLKANAVFLVINPSTKIDKLTYILQNSDASILLCDRQRLQTSLLAAKETPSLYRIICTSDEQNTQAHAKPIVMPFSEIIQTASPEVPRRQCIDFDLATIIYTSGSTGFPKGVMSTHLNVISAATSITQYLKSNSRDIILNVLPFSFDYGLYQLLMAFKVGATLVLEKSFVFPYKVIDLIEKEHVTGFPGVPTIFAILLQLKDLKQHTFPSLRYITNTAAALPVDHIRRLREAFPYTEIYSMYGLTECKRVSYLPPEELDRRPDSVGKAIPNTEVYVVDENGQRLPPGMVGELVVRGAHVMRGYWRAPEVTAKTYRQGEIPGETVLYTGDLFRMDEEGFLYFVGRKDDIIKSRGEKVSPKEVENVLYALEDIVEAAVIGVPDPVLGQAIKAMVVLREGSHLSDREIIAHCARRLEDFMVPKSVEFRTSLPKTTTGKIGRKELV